MDFVPTCNWRDWTGKFSKSGKNDHGVIPGDNKMGMIRSGAIEYPEDMEDIPEHYKGKNWVPNKK